MCCCPAHEDRTPSLSVRVGETRLLFKCFAGCDISDVLRALRRDDLTALNAHDGGGVPSYLPKEWPQRRARELWGIGRPITWTIAETYLRKDRKSVVEGKSGSVRVDFGGSSIIKKKQKN